MKARVIYKEMNDREGFAIELLSGDDWELCNWYPVEDFNYLHWTILRELRGLQNLGYEIIFS